MSCYVMFFVVPCLLNLLILSAAHDQWQAELILTMQGLEDICRSVKSTGLQSVSVASNNSYSNHQGRQGQNHVALGFEIIQMMQ